MIKRLVNLVVLIPLGILVVVLSVANRRLVRLALNPFSPDDTLLSVSLPFFVFLFLALLAGVVIGSGLTWLSQGKHRKQARDEAHAARKWRQEADRQRKTVEDMTEKKLLSASS